MEKKRTYHGKIVAKKTGIYTVYVFQLDDDSYEMCTLLPHWGPEYQLPIGTKGFVTVLDAVAGETYYDRASNTQKTYQFSKTYLQDFIKDKEIKEIIL